MAEQKKYYIRVPEALVEVSGELYSEYHRIERHLLTLEEKDKRHGITSFANIDAQLSADRESIMNRSAESLEDQVLANMMLEKLYRCLDMLPKEERELIQAIYYDDMSERKLASKTGVHYMTIHSRKKRILGKLKNLLEK